jgi:hypothetical protein
VKMLSVDDLVCSEKWKGCLEERRKCIKTIDGASFTEKETWVHHRQRCVDEKETWVKNAPDLFLNRLPSAMAVAILWAILCRPC